MKSLLLFDLDGTLVDSRLDIARAINHAVEKHGGVQVPLERVLPYIGTTLEFTFKGLLGSPTPELLTLCQDEYRSYYHQHCAVDSRPYPGVAETLAALADRQRAVVTTKQGYMAERVLGLMGLIEHFDLVLGTDKPMKPKPDPGVILKACELLGRRPEQAVMIGDTIFDMQAARAAGSRAIAVAYGYGNPDALLAARPDRVLKLFAELPGLLSEIES